MRIKAVTGIARRRPFSPSHSAPPRLRCISRPLISSRRHRNPMPPRPPPPIDFNAQNRALNAAMQQQQQAAPTTAARADAPDECLAASSAIRLLNQCAGDAKHPAKRVRH